MTFYGKLCTLLLVVGISHFSSAQIANYCDLDLCYGYTGHVACNNDGKFAATCAADATIVPITDDLRYTIVQKHNEYRNKIAQGFDKFKPAARMASMQWDDELARLAELRSRSCNAENDICRNTAAFHYAGQNVAINYFNSFSIDVASTAIKQIDLWFNQYQLTSMDGINEFRDPTGEEFRSFTGMIQEKANRIGCAIVQQTGAAGKVQHIMTCNYAFVNVVGLPVYNAGPVASQCKTGTNVKWTSLCKVAEVYDVNEISILDAGAKININ